MPSRSTSGPMVCCHRVQLCSNRGHKPNASQGGLAPRCQPHSASAPPAPRFLGTNSKWITPPERRHRLRAAGWVASHFIGAAPAIALGPAADILCVHTLCTMLPRTCHQAEQCTLVCHHWSESRRQRAGSGAPITKKPWLCWWWNRRWRGVEAAGSCACALLNAAAADVR